MIRYMTLYIQKSKVVPYSITSVGLGADHGFLAVSPQVTLVTNPVVAAITFHQVVTLPTKEIIPLGQYQNILFGDRGTQV